MQNNVLKWITTIKGICFIVCLFVCPLIFLTDTTQNPYAVQPLFLSIFGGIFILSCLTEIGLKKSINLKFSKIDLFLISFLLLLSISLLYNYFFTSYKIALLNEFIRKSDYLFAGVFFGFLFAKVTTSKVEFSSSSYDFLKKVLLWCLSWLLWKLQAGAFIAVLIFAGGVYVCLGHLKNFAFKECVDILLAGCFCACLYGLFQALGLDLFFHIDITKEFGVRPVSTFGNPNFLASFTLLFLPYSFLLFLKAKGAEQILISGFILLILVLFLALSGTRSAWIGCIVSVIISLICFPNSIRVFTSKKFKIFVLLGTFIFCLFVCGYFMDANKISAPVARISETKQALKLKNISLKSKELTAPLHQRLMMWYCALDNFKNNPILGKGLNSFQLYFSFCQGKLIAKNPALDKIKMQANAVHNEYLEVLNDGGILSFFTYIALLGLFFITIFKRLKNLERDEKVFYLALLFSLIGVLVDNVLNITLRTLLVSFAFWFIFSALNNLNSKTKTVGLKIWQFSVISVLTITVLGGIITVQAKQFLAQKHELMGYKYLIANDYRNTAKEMARAIKISALRPEPFYVLVNANIDQNNFQEALSYADNAIEIYPDYYEIYSRRAALHNAQNETEAALSDLRKTLELLPTYTPAAELYANILSNQKKVEEADKVNLIKLSEILPFEVNLTSYLAEIYFKENDCVQASAFAIRTLQNNMFDKTALNILLACPKTQDESLFAEDVQQLNDLKTRIKNGQDMRILFDLDTLLQDNPQDFWLNNLLAEYYFRKGDFCRAADILKAVKPERDLKKSFMFALANAAEKCGNIVEAKHFLGEILTIDSYDEFAKNKLKNVKI